MLALFLGLLVAGLVATVLAIHAEQTTTRERDDRLVDLVRSEVSARLQGSVSSLRGTSSLAVDGSVSEQEFVEMAREVVPESVYTALAYSEIVTDDDVPRWEAATGIDIKDFDGNGGFVATASRPQHVVVRYVYPESPDSTALIGFDLSSDPARADGAARTAAEAAPAFIGPVKLASSGDAGLFVISAVRGPDDTPIGFVSSGVDVDSAFAPVQGLPNAADVAIEIDGQALRGTPGTGSSRSFSVGGLEFTVWADDGRTPDPTLAVVLGLATLLLAGTAQVVRRSEQAFQRRQAELLRRQTAVSQLGQQLAAAGDSAAVIEIARASLRSIVGATTVDLAVIDASDFSQLHLHHDDGAARRPVSSMRLGERRPIADSVRRNQVVAVHDRTLYASWFPETTADLEREGLHAVLAVPLRFSGGGAFGSVSFAWARPMSTSDLDDDTTVATTIAELVARALERSLVAEAVRDRSAQLSNLAQDLATAQLPSDVFGAVERWVPSIVGAARAVIRPEPDDDDADEDLDPASAVVLPLGVTITRRRQQLLVEWDRPTERSPVVESVLRTVGRLADAALERSEVHQHEHELVEQLQIALLGHDVPDDDLDVAVRYEPAVSLLGMGGDFYDTIHGTDVDYLVVGDVTGHGPSAVASMAELKTLTRHLLLRGDDLGDVCAHLDEVLVRLGSFATMTIVVVDHPHGVIRHLSAGHPYALLRTGECWAPVTDGRRSLLGVPPSAPVAASTHPFVSGDAIVLYTDGLIEDRRTPLHESIEAIRAALSGWSDATAAALADRIVEHQTTDRTPSRTDDDIAVLVAAHR
jgi:sensor domain CHASE-containing protein